MNSRELSVSRTQYYDTEYAMRDLAIQCYEKLSKLQITGHLVKGNLFYQMMEINLNYIVAPRGT